MTGETADIRALSFKDIDYEQTRNECTKTLRQLSSRGQGYFVVKLPENMINNITTDLISTFKALSNSKFADNVFGGLDETGSNLKEDTRRKSFVFESSHLKHNIIKEYLDDKSITPKQIKDFISFITDFRNFLSGQQCIKNLTTSTRGKFNIVNDIIFSVITSSPPTDTQAVHSDYDPVGL